MSSFLTKLGIGKDKEKNKNSSDKYAQIAPVSSPNVLKSKINSNAVSGSTHISSGHHIHHLHSHSNQPSTTSPNSSKSPTSSSVNKETISKIPLAKKDIMTSSNSTTSNNGSSGLASSGGQMNMATSTISSSHMTSTTTNGNSNLSTMSTSQSSTTAASTTTKVKVEGSNDLGKVNSPMFNIPQTMTNSNSSLAKGSPKPLKKVVEQKPESKPENSSSSSKQVKQKYKLDDFVIMQTLGTGSFGRVHLVKLKSTGKYYAMKVLVKRQIVESKQVEHTINEKKILEILDHPYMVNMLGSFKDNHNLYFILDYVCGGELFSYLRQCKRLPNHVARFYAAEVVLAFEHLHSKDIIYRDLKPENLLIDKSGHIKITDFGFAKYVPDVTWTLCGTPDYLAPEIIQSKGYSKAVDWYALGILIYEMLAGFPPFYDEDQMKLYERILEGRLRWPSYFDPAAKDLIKRLLSPDLTKRFGNLKSGSADIKKHKWFSEIDWKKLAEVKIKAPYIPPFTHEGDASNFDPYPEDHDPYGLPGPDLYTEEFKDF